MTVTEYFEGLNALVVTKGSDLKAAFTAREQIAEPTVALVEREIASRHEFLKDSRHLTYTSRSLKCRRGSMSSPTGIVSRAFPRFPTSCAWPCEPRWAAVRYDSQYQTLAGEPVRASAFKGETSTACEQL